MTRSRLRRILLWGAAVFSGLLILGSLAYFSAPLILAGEPQSQALIEQLPDGSVEPSSSSSSTEGLLKVMTLNIAHARNQAPNQLLLSRSRFESNLEAIATVLARENPDVAALQEADGPSVWSGGFDHVRWLAEGAEYPQWVRGRHVDGIGLSYGTAVLSQLPIVEARSTTFDPEPPFSARGLVRTRVQTKLCGGAEVDVVSLHLDPLRNSVRQRQIAAAIASLEDLERPLIVMGDFNDEWLKDNSQVQVLADSLDLKAYMPNSNDLKTFPLFGLRLDWILVSEDLDFVSYEVIEDEVSDHRAVAAEVKLNCDP